MRATQRAPRATSVPPVLRHLSYALAIFVLVLLALPYLIVPLYRFVQPVSTPMLWRWMAGKRFSAHCRSDRAHRTRAADGRHRRRRWHVLPDPLRPPRPRCSRPSHGRGRRPRRRACGGSTITQQTAKNLFLWNGRSFVRKALEIPLAVWMNLVLPKRRVLEIYLNIAEWGPNGEFGAEAGARWAFGKSARDLTAREAGGSSRPATGRTPYGAARAERRTRWFAGSPASTSTVPRRTRTRCLHPPPRPLASRRPFFYKRPTSVIPGRAKSASPESITPRQGVWIPRSSLRSTPE